MWQRFTERAKGVMELAQSEAARRGAPWVDPEHLLLALLTEPDSNAGRALSKVGATLKVALGHLPTPLAGMEPVTGEAQKIGVRVSRVVALAYSELRTTNQRWIGTEHLLLGLLRDEDPIVMRLLSAMDVRADDLRRAIRELPDREDNAPASAFHYAKLPVSEEPSQLRSMLRGIREATHGPDIVALVILREPSPEIVELLHRLGTDETELGISVESEILHGPDPKSQRRCQFSSLWNAGNIDDIFRRIARHPGSATHRALLRMGRTAEEIDSALAD